MDFGKNKTVKSATIYDEITSYVDNVTGEVISYSKKSITKRKDVTEFTMIFIEGLSRLTNSNLTQGQAKVLFEAMKYSVNNTNMLYINQSTKELIAQETGLKYGTVENCISELVKKELILRVKRAYLLNPLVFGRGGLDNVKKLTQILEIEYDFEKGTAVEKMTTKSLYKEADKTDLKNSKIIEAKSNTSEDGKITEQEIVIDDSVNVDSNKQMDIVQVTELEVLDKKDNYELELLKEKNREKELQIRELELKIKAKEMGIS